MIPRSTKDLALVALAATLLYLPTLRFGFAYDDAIVVLTHPQVQGHMWGAIMTSPYHVGADVRIPTGAYRPLTIASLAANHAATGLHAWSYHLVNVILNSLTAVLVLLLGLELGLARDASLVGALAFAVHPVHVEAVANVAGRAEVLSTALAVAALLVYVRARNAGTATGRGAVTMAILLGAAAFAKENVVTIVGVVALWELLRGLRLRDSAIWLVAAAAPIALYLASRVAVLGGIGLGPGAVTAIENPVVGLHGIARAATVLAVFGRATSLVVTPFRLSPDYGYAEITPSAGLLTPGPIVGALCLTILLVAIAFSWRRAPLVAFLLGSAIGTYAIVSNAFVLIGTVLGDRLLYLPSVFVCVAFGLAVSALAKRVGRPPAWSAAAIVLVLFAIRSATYAERWRDDATLFEYAARIAPQSVRNVGSWGALLAESGRFDDAFPFLDRAVAIAPDFIPNRLNRAAAELTSGRLAAAEADARRVLEIEPGNALARKQLAAIEGLRR